MLEDNVCKEVFFHMKITKVGLVGSSGKIVALLSVALLALHVCIGAQKPYIVEWRPRCVSSQSTGASARSTVMFCKACMARLSDLIL